MAITQTRPKRKVSGGRYISYRKKRKHEIGKYPTQTKVGKTQSKSKRTRGGNQKTSLLHADTINLLSKNKQIKAKILTVKDSSANRHFVRRNILTKGTIIETDKGLAKITNRPGQEGTINGILVEWS